MKNVSMRTVAIVTGVALCAVLVTSLASPALAFQTPDPAGPPPLPQPTTRPAAGEDSPPPGATADDAVAQAKTLPDAELARLIEGRFLDIPAPESISPTELPKVAQFADETFLMARTHLERFPKSESRVSMIIHYCRLQQLNEARWLRTQLDKIKDIEGRRAGASDVQALKQVYHGAIRTMVDEALRLQPTPPQEHLIFQILGDSLMSLGQNAEACDAFEKALKLDPAGAEADRLWFNVIDSAEKAALYERCLAKCDEWFKGFTQFPRTRYAPHAAFVAHKAHRHGGTLKQGLEFWEKVMPFYEAGTLGKPMPNDPEYIVEENRRGEYLTYRDRYIFYKAFLNFALGNKETAEAQFQEYLDYMDKREAEAQNGGLPLDQAATPYRRHQALPYVTTLYGLIDQPAPSLEIGLENWLIPPSPEGDVESPHSMAIFFCPLRRDRYSQLFPLLNEIGRKYADRGLRMAWIAIPTTTKAEKFPEMQTEFLEESEKYRLDNWALGFDPMQNSPAHTAYYATRGTGDLYLIGPDGNVRWRLIDPMHWDEGMLRRVFERIYGDE